MSKLKSLFKNKAIRVTAVVVLCLAICFSILCAVYMAKPSGSASNDLWYRNMSFDINEIPVLNKEAGKDFVIVNFADIQMADIGDIGKRDITFDMMRTLVETYNPDLITLTGDQVWSPQTKFSFRKIVSLISSFGIPWAPVFGNHDAEGTSSYEYMCDVYESAENCLFRRGGYNLGYGNYAISIAENGVPVRTIFMMDTHRSIRVSENKTAKGITDAQIDWYKWTVDNLTELNNGVQVPSMAFFHVPLPEYEDAYKYWSEETDFDENVGFGAFGEEIKDDGTLDFGTSYDFNNGFFDVMKDYGTTHVFCGHDHRNNFSILYEGVRLTYCQKTGDLAYYGVDENGSPKIGGTVITVNDDVFVEQKIISVS